MDNQMNGNTNYLDVILMQLHLNLQILIKKLLGILQMGQLVVASQHLSFHRLICLHLLSHILQVQEILIKLILELDWLFILVLVMDLRNKMEVEILHFCKNVWVGRQLEGFQLFFLILQIKFFWEWRMINKCLWKRGKIILGFLMQHEEFLLKMGSKVYLKEYFLRFWEV